MQFVVLAFEGSQGSPKTIAQASQARIMAMGEQFLARDNDALETLVGFDAGQAKGRSPLEGQQVARMTGQLGDDGVGHSPI